jgi:S-(hydroxymethyl)glutathione dehydrogenase / alcohol dehydrogenase
MEMTAAVLYEPNKPMQVERIEIDDPSDGEVLVRIVAAGICHSDYHIMNGDWGMPLPAVLGHEGAGVVEKIGAGVNRVKVGDHVILNFRANCGTCNHCIVGRPVLCDGIESPRYQMFDGTVRFHRNGNDINQMARTSCFAEYTVVPESGAVPIRKDMPLEAACLTGCAVMTGVGAVTNTARMPAGSNIAVIGCGGVGLNVVQGGVLAGADRIVAIDMLDNKLEFAKQMGATDVVNAGNGDAAAQVMEMTGGGVDFALVAVGNGKAIEQAYEMCKLGGTTVVVGMAPESDTIELSALSFPRSEKAIIGSWYGSARPWVDLPKLVDLYMADKLKIDEMISRTWKLEEINEAYDVLMSGEVARSVIKFD